MSPDMTTVQVFLARIDAFLAEEGMTEREFGLKVCGNHKLVPRLRAGRGFSVSTRDRAELLFTGKPLPEREPRVVRKAA